MPRSLKVALAAIVAWLIFPNLVIGALALFCGVLALVLALGILVHRPGRGSLVTTLLAGLAGAAVTHFAAERRLRAYRAVPVPPGREEYERRQVERGWR